MSDTTYRRIIVGCLVALSITLLVVARLVRELLDACVVRPDGSLDSCKPNTILVTTMAVMP